MNIRKKSETSTPHPNIVLLPIQTLFVHAVGKFIEFP